ncbi:hypothetical protein SF83666_b48590 (plasmid) [Sinorhizobium fredii CCBAU 83666]|nr:hypothetical protein SF83666_b48590 [Sinorhizobium fredii CCBAU 83666]
MRQYFAAKAELESLKEQLEVARQGGRRGDRHCDGHPGSPSSS